MDSASSQRLCYNARVAVVLLFRLAIQVAPIVYRVCVTSGCDLNQWSNAALRFYSRLTDPDEDPAVLSDDITASLGDAEGAFVAVTDFTGTFELRKLQWRLSRAPAGGTVEDVDVMTFHFIKATGGTPGTYVDGTDLPAVETALGTFWGAIKANYPSWTHSDQYRWYKDGPAFYVLNTEGTHYVPAGDNPALRVTEVDVAGTLGAGTAMLPPQVASTITERTSSRRHWGRFYLPAMTSSNASADGRLNSSPLGTILGAAVTFYNSCRSSSMIPVVWSIQKPERPKKPSGTLPAYSAQAFEITSLQMDDLFDVIRSRRYGAPTIRTNTALT